MTGSAQIATSIRVALAARLENDDLGWEFRGCNGNPAAELTKIVCAVHADAIVVGAPHSIVHRRLGSPTTRLVKSRHSPVIVIP
jgi:nucleotide-binding universal stress UspA family protein